MILDLYRSKAMKITCILSFLPASNTILDLIEFLGDFAKFLIDSELHPDVLSRSYLSFEY